jgi:hypothetical protein
MINELWTAVYYPKEIIESQRSKAILCLLFDKILCHFPVSSMACGGGHGMSDDFSKNLLVENGVIELIEEELIPDVGEEYYDQDLDKYVDLQITAMALEKCKEDLVVPITDNPKFKIPASIIEEIDISRNAKLQATAIAISSVEMILPPINELSEEDVLIAREKLSDQLIPFRRNMLKLSPLLRNMINENSTVKNIYAEARYLTETSIMPALSELRERIEKEKGVFWRKLLMRSGKVLPKFILNWSQKNLISAAIDSLGDLTEIGISSIDRQSLIDNLKKEGGLGFLLSLEDQFRI